MNQIKKLTAALLVIAMIFSLAACHPKDEQAMKIGDVEITSALYMCALIQADSEGRNKVDENAASDVSNINYQKQTIDEVDYTTWVKNRAEEICMEYAAYETKFKELSLKLSDETQSTITAYANYYWSTGGYSTLYGENGVTLDTFKRFFTYQYKSQEYFMSIYGKEGTSPVAESDIVEFMKTNYTPVYMLTQTYNTTNTEGSSVAMSDDEKKALTDKYNAYAERLKNGESFETIYIEVNGKAIDADDADTASGDTSSSNTSSTGSSDVSSTASSDSSTTSSGASSGDSAEPAKPADKYAQLLGSMDTTSGYKNYDKVKAMAVGDVQVIDEETGISLIVKKDISEDPYYLTYLNDEILYKIKQEEFEASVKAFAKTLSFTKNEYAVNRFKPKNIVYPTTSK